jgi:hypothetical protein
LIKQGVGLEVAAVDYGDWDMHADMGTVDAGWMHDHLTELGAALFAFATDLGSGMDTVTFTTLTEFGRRVEDNGSGGTDHGYGQLVTLMGGNIKGGAVHLNGAWPTLADDALLDGDLRATTDYRALLSSLLQKRCAASASDVNSIFPGIGGIPLPDVANPTRNITRLVRRPRAERRGSHRGNTCRMDGLGAPAGGGGPDRDQDHHGSPSSTPRCSPRYASGSRGATPSPLEEMLVAADEPGSGTPEDKTRGGRALPPKPSLDDLFARAEAEARLAS